MDHCSTQVSTTVDINIGIFYLNIIMKMLQKSVLDNNVIIFAYNGVAEWKLSLIK